MSQLCLNFAELKSATAQLELVFQKVHRQLKPRTPIPSMQTEFFPSVGANHSVSLENGLLHVRISDLFHDAPIEILETLAIILLSKLYKKKVDNEHQKAYRRFTLSSAMLERSRLTRARRGKKPITTAPRGKNQDLDTVFNDLNTIYFKGALRKPCLSWTPTEARSILGRYNYDDDIIYISRILDSVNIPDYVLKYILFHEMLHIKHQPKISNLREIVHTREFRQEEKRFKHYREANLWLKQN